MYEPLVAVTPEEDVKSQRLPAAAAAAASSASPPPSAHTSVAWLPGSAEEQQGIVGRRGDDSATHSRPCSRRRERGRAVFFQEEMLKNWFLQQAANVWPPLFEPH